MSTEVVLQRARRLATIAHGDQKYGDEFPYAVHLQATESVLLRFGITDFELRAIAWLHDVLEDTEKTYEELEVFFGSAIADAVADLTRSNVSTNR
jgi:guanosine-3',5'-bis(diphosphate) 3'-pyrophosphohydrolase